MRLRRQVAFNQFLARIFSGEVTGIIAKGGYTLELRLNKSRSTKDIDFFILLFFAVSHIFNDFPSRAAGFIIQDITIEDLLTSGEE